MTMTLSSNLASSDKTRQLSPVSLFSEATNCSIASQVSLAPLTSFRVGGPAQWYVAPKNLEQLQGSINWAKSEDLPIMFLGAGSNLLVSDRGINGLVVGTRYLRQTHFDSKTGLLTVGAGEPIPRLAWKAAQLGWEGLEWAVGIPGTVGGAVVMNAGAQGKCTSEILVNVHTVSPDGKLQILSKEELEYGYRTSKLQGKEIVVTQATFQLKPGSDPTRVTATTSANFNLRRSTQPYHLPSCGSVFRNPEPKTAGWLIEQTGLKGYQIGMAQVSQLHANFILNCGGAKAREIFRLISYVQERVEERWSLKLLPEVKMLGDFSDSL
jgi:UDP-N-acetylmuramate dehydrogenase